MILWCTSSSVAIPATRLAHNTQQTRYLSSTPASRKEKLDYTIAALKKRWKKKVPCLEAEEPERLLQA